jgi:hypothetical protein
LFLPHVVRAAAGRSGLPRSLLAPAAGRREAFAHTDAEGRGSWGKRGRERKGGSKYSQVGKFFNSLTIFVRSENLLRLLKEVKTYSSFQGGGGGDTV